MIYFDNAATTLVNELVLKKYNEEVIKSFANPSSIHSLGMNLTYRINNTRNNMLKLLNLPSKEYEIIFLSSATEANNLAIRGYCLKNKNKGKTILTTKIEHASVLEVYKDLETNYGFIIKYIKIKESGDLDIEDLKEKINDDTILITLTPVNNEVGLYFNIKEVKDVIQKYPKCKLHLDCAQTLGKIKFDYCYGDLLSLSSHKIHGLKSIACLIKKKNINLSPLLIGGGQENNLRSSTLDAPLIFSFEEALKETVTNFQKNYAKVQLIFDYLGDKLSKIEGIKLNLFKNQSPFILNFSLNKKASVVVEALSNKEIYVSSVSACSSKKEEPSYVLLSLNKSLEEAKNSIRISFSENNTLEECDIFIDTLKGIINTIRGK